jgi:hypothetical protein
MGALINWRNGLTTGSRVPWWVAGRNCNSSCKHAAFFTCLSQMRIGECMPIWVTKQMPIASWGAIQFRMMAAQHHSRSPFRLAMLRRRGELGCPDDIFILLAEEGLKAHFPGFEEVSQDNVPAGLRLLVGDELEVVARFPDVAAKLLPF